MDLLNRKQLKQLQKDLHESSQELKKKSTELESKKKQLEEAIKAIHIIGYNLHHLGQDIADERSESILFASNDIKSTNGRAMSEIGSVLRQYGLGVYTSDKLNLKTLAKMFGKTIDNAHVPSDENFIELKNVLSA